MFSLAISLAATLSIPTVFRPRVVEISSSAHVNATDIIQPKSTRMRCTLGSTSWVCEGGWIEKTWIDDLLREARRPQRAGDVAIAGFSRARLVRISRVLAADVRSDPQWSPAEREAALTLTTVSAVRSAILARFYPLARRVAVDAVHTRVVVRMSDGTDTLAIESPAHGMLPWTITYDGRNETSIDARLSMLIARLLPPGDANQAELVEQATDPIDDLIADIDFRVIACRYDENRSDRAFCALIRAKRAP